MLYIANHDTKSVTPLTDEQELQLFGLIKALDLRMLRVEDYPFMREVFVTFTNMANADVPAGGLRVVDMLAFTKAQLLTVKMPGLNDSTLTKKLDKLQALYGVAPLPSPSNDGMDVMFFRDQLTGMVDSTLMNSWVGFPDVHSLSLKDYIQKIKSYDMSQHPTGDMQICLSGALSRFGMRLFKDSPDGILWGMFQDNSKTSLQMLAALPSDLTVIGAEKLGMTVYLQPKLL